MNTQKVVTSSIKTDKGTMLIIKKCSWSNKEVAAIHDAMNYKHQTSTMKKFMLPQLKIITRETLV